MWHFSLSMQTILITTPKNRPVAAATSVRECVVTALTLIESSDASNSTKEYPLVNIYVNLESSDQPMSYTNDMKGGRMDDGYRLQAYITPNGNTFWELTNGTPSHGDFAKMLRSPRTAQTAVNLIRQIDKIIDCGIKSSCATGKLRLLNAEIGLYEVKGYAGVNREMAYIVYQEPLKVVLLFSFKGHQGSGNIHSGIRKARPLAIVANKLVNHL